MIPTCKLARDLATTLRAVLHYAQPPEYTRDISAQEVYFDLLENARQLVVKARTFESDLTTEDTEDTERENDLQCELAAWELLREADSKLSEALEDLEFRRGLYKVQEEYLEAARRDLAEAREQNAKLLSIAERAIDDLRWFYESKADGVILELKQLKEAAK